jgi:hypothetical protein
MREGPLSAVTALALVTLVLAGCDQALIEARPSSKPAHSAPDRSPLQRQPQPVQLLDTITGPGVLPEAVPSAAFGGLQARVLQATDEAVASGATLSVAILDRGTHQMVSNGNSQIAGTASVAKLFIADELLMQESEGGTRLSTDDRNALDMMLQSSDDGAAEKFWDQNGQGAIINQVASRYGLMSTAPPSDGRWWNTNSTVDDLIRYYDMLLAGAGGLPAQLANLIVDDLAQSTPHGDDGYPQRFGIPDGLYAEPVAVKQGWMCCIGSAWMHLSTGVIGTDRRYVMVIESLQTSDDVTARQTITQAVKTIFPNGRI